MVPVQEKKEVDVLSRLRLLYGQLEDLISETITKALTPYGQELNKLRPTKEELFHLTEERLRNHPKDIARVEYNKLNMVDLQKEFDISLGNNKSKSIVKMPTPNSGERCEPHDILEIQLKELQKRIYSDQFKINEMCWALQCLKNEPYGFIIDMFYFDRLKMSAIANWLSHSKEYGYLACDDSTLFKKKNAMVREIVYRLYPEYFP